MSVSGLNYLPRRLPQLDHIALYIYIYSYVMLVFINFA